MLTTTSIKYSFKLFTILFIVFLFLFLFFGYYFQNNFNQDNIIERVEKKILLKDKNVSHELTFLKNKYNQNPDSIFSIVDRYKNLYEESGSFYLIFDNDSLVFWSDNKASINYNSLNTDAEIIFSGNGWFRKILIDQDNLIFAGLYLIKSKYPYQNEYLENSFHKTFGLDSHIGFSPDVIEKQKVTDNRGHFLFSLKFNTTTSINNSEANILFILFIITLLLLIAVLYSLHLLIYNKTKKYFLFSKEF